MSDGSISALIDHQAELQNRLDQLRLEVGILAFSIVGLSFLLALALRKPLAHV